ncbi:MAG: pitrilysin family protein [Gemmatimonadetes bacterium]|nr:pitrilysin family protein [Gemmatimonadota bacterium]
MMWSKRAYCVLVLSAVLLGARQPAYAQGTGEAVGEADEVEISYEMFVLDNGLTLIVHEDHRAPIVAVNVWYHVGSKNEKPGRTGFAHLFEHLMFNGSENYNDEYFGPFERAGATDMNGTTNPDRTNYFANVPTPALDMALWMESDRMGHMLGAIDQAKLEEQRGVVQNEKRQGENQPYGVVRQLLSESTYPSDHPYSWTTIGVMEDLSAATLEDVKEWFKKYYGPNNAVIVIAGDIDAQTAKEKVEKYFGSILASPPVAKPQRWIAKMQGEKRQTVQDRVPQARIYMVWNVPEWGSADADYLDLVSDVLAQGKSSRLYKRLVYEDQIATDVFAFVSLREIGGQFQIRGTARPGQDLSGVETAIDEEMERFLLEGPTAEELQRVKTQYRARLVRGAQRIGGFGGKSDVLATSQVYGGSPDYYKVRLNRVQNATADDLLAAAREWLSDGVYVLEVHPYPEFRVAQEDADRSAVPDPGPAPDVHFPELQRASLANGLEVILAERHAIPLVSFNLLVDAGFAADQFGLPGTADLALDMMDEGTGTRSALEISDALAMLGAQLRTGSGLDASSVSLSALTGNLDASLEIYTDVILDPVFPQADFERLKKQQLAGIQREKMQPQTMAFRILPALLYGEGHAYSNPLTGSGTEESVARITREDLVDFHRTWFRPDNAQLVVVGDVTLAELLPKLERLFAEWEPGDVPPKNIGEVSGGSGSVVYLLDRPDAVQSLIIGGSLIVPKANPDEVAIETVNNILGGTFTSRINMNLREDKHWAYGAFTFIPDTKAQRPLIVYAPVQTDRTSESLRELLAELRGILGPEPITSEELSKVQELETRSMAGRWETNGEVQGGITEIVTFGLPDDYYERYGRQLRALDVAELSAAAREIIVPDGFVWVVVGDRTAIEDPLRELGLGPIRLIDADGRLIDEDGRVIDEAAASR